MALFDQVLQEGEEEKSRIAQWGDVVNSPEGQAALLQFGINMLQPAGYGKSFLGGLGRAVGAGGEAVARMKKQRMEEEEQAAELEDKRLRRQEAGERLKQAERRTSAYEKAVEGRTKGGVSLSQLMTQRRFEQGSFRKWFGEQLEAESGLAPTPESIQKSWDDLQKDPARMNRLIQRWRTIQQAEGQAIGAGPSGAVGTAEPPGGFTAEEWDALTPEEQAEFE